ncbi:zinc finger, C3HC4 type (RING finger) protein (macronuclear) [Tetrahymena thermophila SB210]|uniref:Zinc finger, C3HC4 type (RING finger) protein n=1 Tax=Tetrahymena thermophila (strain SB210) TaxID=312017 RepID=Q22GY2_TETTS|nr:zinc finger, C3HC4 type (RING finger) protein [Tetrahymena thermophila SB210]EAR84542.1 zinc finger, C3HC4 type (RING finger) protein [Tetrahymena thermophila SB210]|eukprot:XP_001032205.1 zinc finger, C3HC4 type (RING finger) protein [Tetrahymena thermophila SB210]
MAESKKKSSQTGVGILAGLAGVAIGAIGAFLYKELKDDKKTDNGNGQKAPQNVEIKNKNDKNTNQTEDQDQYNENLFCPISFVPMTDPYILKNCGHSFQKETIDQCLQKKLECPLCRKQCQKEDLVPNFSLKSLVQDMIKNQSK